MKNKDLTAVVLDETQLNVIQEKYGNRTQYCDFKGYYSTIIYKLKDTTEVTEVIYFRALEKLGVVERDESSGNYVPPFSVRETWSGDQVAKGIYRRKKIRGQDGYYSNNYGFNCEDSELLQEKVGDDLVKLLDSLCDALAEAKKEVKKAKEILRAQGLPVSLVTFKDRKNSIIKKFLGA